MQDDGRGEREERLAQQLRHLAKNHAAENREASVSKFILCGFPIEMWKLSGGRQAAIFLHANPKKSIFQKYAQKLKNVNMELS